MDKKNYVYASELAELSGTTYGTIKTYSMFNLLPYKQEGKKEWKKYDKDLCLTILNRIKELKQERKTLKEIKKIIRQEFKF